MIRIRRQSGHMPCPQIVQMMRILNEAYSWLHFSWSFRIVSFPLSLFDQVRHVRDRWMRWPRECVGRRQQEARVPGAQPATQRRVLLAQTPRTPSIHRRCYAHTHTSARICSSRCFLQFHEFESSISSLAFNHDGTLLAIAVLATLT